MLELAVSVGELVAFCHRAGGIDHRFRPSPTGGQRVAGNQRLYRRRGGTYRTEYPADGSTVATLHAATAQDVGEAVQAAERARLQSTWAGLKRHERAGMLYRIASGIRARGEELAQLQRLESNLTPVESQKAA